MPYRIQGCDSANCGDCDKEHSRCWVQKLFSPGDRITLIHPVRAEIVGDVQHLDVGKSQRAQGIVGGLHVGTMAPRATAAVENDQLRSRGDATRLRSCCKPVSLDAGPMYSD